MRAIANKIKLTRERRRWNSFFPVRSLSLTHLRHPRQLLHGVCVERRILRVNIAHTLVIRNIRKLSKQSLNHYLSKWFIFLCTARAHTHVDCRCHSVVHSVVCYYCHCAIATIVLWSGNFHLLLVCSHKMDVEIKFHFTQFTHYHFDCRVPMRENARSGRDTEMKRRWSAKNAFQQNDVFVRSFGSFVRRRCSFSLVFILNCTHVLLNERTKW